MRTFIHVVPLALFLLIAPGCDKKDNPVDQNQTTTNYIFSSNNVKNAPVYFSFDAKDSVTSLQPWDLKLTAVSTLVDTPSNFYIKLPTIVMNRARNVQGKIVSSGTFESVDPATVTGLQADPTDSTFTIGTECLYYTGAPAHKLNPYDNRTFVLQSGTGKRIKFRMLSYYNDQGLSGYMKLEYVIK